jgi:ribosome biogenesis GTPase A
MATQTRNVLDRLDALGPFFSGPEDAPEDAQGILAPVLELQTGLRREERRVTFFGAFKAGKSTLLNALIGAPVLPARTHRTARSIATIRYGTPPRVELVREGADGMTMETVSFDDAAAAILANGNDSNGASRVEEVRIVVPHALLAGACLLVDTPGLLEDEELTERSRREIERADLAIMVLSADKILSSQERVLAAWANDLLHGNVAFVVNRLDLVDEDDREELLDWAGAALAETGNSLIGKSRVFATAAKGSSLGVNELEEWLRDLFAKEIGDRIAALSRLGLLNRRLNDAGEQVRSQLAEVRELTRVAQQANQELLAREKVSIKRDVSQGRKRLEAARANLSAAGDAFVSWCVEDTRGSIRPGMQGPIHLELEDGAEAYAEAVSEEFAGALAGVPLTVPAFDLSDWIFRAQVDPATHPFTETWVRAGDIVSQVLGKGDAGREAGATIGGWIGKNAFGVDIEAETTKRIEGGARAALESLLIEVDAYLERLNGLLDQVDRYYDEWSHSSPELTLAEDRELGWVHLFHWWESFQCAVTSAVEDIGK